MYDGNWKTDDWKKGKFWGVLRKFSNSFYKSWDFPKYNFFSFPTWFPFKNWNGDVGAVVAAFRFDFFDWNIVLISRVVTSVARYAFPELFRVAPFPLPLPLVRRWCSEERALDEVFRSPHAFSCCCIALQKIRGNVGELDRKKTNDEERVKETQHLKVNSKNSMKNKNFVQFREENCGNNWKAQFSVNFAQKMINVREIKVKLYKIKGKNLKMMKNCKTTGLVNYFPLTLPFFRRNSQKPIWN